MFNKTTFGVALLILTIVVGQNDKPLTAQIDTSKRRQETNTQPVDLSPNKWPAGELDRYLKIHKVIGNDNKTASSQKAVIAGTTGGPAVRAGMEAMRQGGSAVDGALTASLAQITLSQGAWNSYAGIMTMIYYDASIGEIHSMNAGYNTILAEDDPLTIPDKAGGRTVLVPGYMAGVQAAHNRFGRLPFDQLFVPAIYFAKDGFELTSLNESMMNARADVLSRLPETKKLYTDKSTGKFFQKDQLFKQPELATTLENVSNRGAAYMYTGDWAQKLVKVVQANGGKISDEDLKRYKVQWTQPLRTNYRDVEIVLPGLPADGGIHVAEALNLIDASKLNKQEHYSKSPEAFFWLSQINTAFAQSYFPTSTLKAIFGKETSKQDRTTKEFAESLWQKMRADEFPLTKVPKEKINGHSDAIVAIDQWGNVAALVHTINTSAWGHTGINIDGISIPDSAAIQKEAVQRAGPGNRLPEMTEPLLILKNGKPVAAFSSIGAGLHACTVCTLTNFLDFNQDLRSAIQSPSMHLPEFDAFGNATQVVRKGDFSNEMIESLRKMGLKIKEVPKSERAQWGYVIGATIDQETGQRSAVSTSSFNAPAIGD